MMRIAAMVRSVPRALAIALTLALFSGGVVAISVAPVAAVQAAKSTATPVVGIKYPGGPGHAGPVFAHVWELGGKRGPCVDFGKSTADGDGVRVITKLPGTSTENSKRAFALTEKHRFTTSNDEAAALALSVWSLRGDSSFRKWFKWAKKEGVISKNVLRLMDRMLKDSKSHGPYTVKVDVKAVGVGASGSGTVTVLDSRGKPAKGMKAAVKRTTKNVKVLKVGSKTKANGKLRFTFKRVKSGRAGFKATVAAPSVKKALLSVPSKGRQRLLVGGFKDSVSGSADFDQRAGAPSVTTTCDTDCDGQATVTVKYCNPKSNASAIRWVVTGSEVKLLQLDVGVGTCETRQFRSTDGTVLVMSHCDLNRVGGKCTSKYKKLNKPYEIVCPAWAEAVLAIPCSCDPRKKGSVTFTSPGNSPRYYTGHVSFGGGLLSYDYELTNGVALKKEFDKVKPGTVIEVSFTVYRDAARTIPLGTHVLQSVTVN